MKGVKLTPSKKLPSKSPALLGLRTTVKHISDTHRENCALLNSLQGFIEIEAWLLLSFFLCLHNHLISIHSIFTY